MTSRRREPAAVVRLCLILAVAVSVSTAVDIEELMAGLEVPEVELSTIRRCEMCKDVAETFNPDGNICKAHIFHHMQCNRIKKLLKVPAILQQWYRTEEPTRVCDRIPEITSGGAGDYKMCVYVLNKLPKWTGPCLTAVSDGDQTNMDICFGINTQFKSDSGHITSMRAAGKTPLEICIKYHFCPVAVERAEPLQKGNALRRFVNDQSKADVMRRDLDTRFEAVESNLFQAEELATDLSRNVESVNKRDRNLVDNLVREALAKTREWVGVGPASRLLVAMLEDLHRADSAAKIPRVHITNMKERINWDEAKLAVVRLSTAVAEATTADELARATVTLAPASLRLEDDRNLIQQDRAALLLEIGDNWHRAVKFVMSDFADSFPAAVEGVRSQLAAACNAVNKEAVRTLDQCLSKLAKLKSFGYTSFSTEIPVIGSSYRVGAAFSESDIAAADAACTVETGADGKDPLLITVLKRAQAIEDLQKRFGLFIKSLQTLFCGESGTPNVNFMRTVLYCDRRSAPHPLVEEFTDALAPYTAYLGGIRDGVVPTAARTLVGRAQNLLFFEKTAWASSSVKQRKRFVDRNIAEYNGVAAGLFGEVESQRGTLTRNQGEAVPESQSQDFNHEFYLSEFQEATLNAHSLFEDQARSTLETQSYKLEGILVQSIGELGLVKQALGQLIAYMAKKEPAAAGGTGRVPAAAAVAREDRYGSGKK